MQFGYFNYPMPANETVLSYAPGSPEKTALKKALADSLKNAEKCICNLTRWITFCCSVFLLKTLPLVCQLQ